MAEKLVDTVMKNLNADAALDQTDGAENSELNSSNDKNLDSAACEDDNLKSGEVCLEEQLTSKITCLVPNDVTEKVQKLLLKRDEICRKINNSIETEKLQQFKIKLTATYERIFEQMKYAEDMLIHLSEIYELSTDAVIEKLKKERDIVAQKMKLQAYILMMDKTIQKLSTDIPKLIQDFSEVAEKVKQLDLDLEVLNEWLKTKTSCPQSGEDASDDKELV